MKMKTKRIILLPKYIYDAMDNQTAVYRNNILLQTKGYDELSRLTTITNGLTQTQTYTYDLHLDVTYSFLIVLD